MTIYAQLACAMPRDPRMMAAGWQARAVYVEAMLYCRENLTDGVIDRLVLAYWMPDIPLKTKVRQLDHLLALGALEAHKQGWRFPEKVWRKWNPLKSEVEAKRAEDAERKAQYRARKKAETDASRNVPTGQSVAGTTCPRQPEPEPERKPEPEPEPYKSSLDSYAGPSRNWGELIQGGFKRIDDVA